MFNHYARVLAFIPRWAVVPVVRRQHVAEHSYYVSLYTMELLKLDAFRHWHSDKKLCAIQYALTHDMAEARMSDIPGPVKRMTQNKEKYDLVESRVVSDMGYAGYVDEDIQKLIKVADLIDEYFYLSVEVSLGSNFPLILRQQVRDRLSSAVNVLLGFGSDAAEVMACVDMEANTVEESGFWTLSNNSDVEDPAMATDIPF